MILKFILVIITKAEWNDRFKSTLKYKFDHIYLKHDSIRPNGFLKIFNYITEMASMFVLSLMIKFTGAYYRHTSPNTYTHIEPHRQKKSISKQKTR